jgi:major membrane immunogen (membrane-anchored lipoprotein)
LKDNYLDDNNIIHHNKDNKFDIVMGEIADGKIADIAYNVRNGLLNLKDIDYSQILTDDKSSYGDQISFHTRKSLSCIVSITCDIIRKRKVANSYEQTSKRI